MAIRFAPLLLIALTLEPAAAEPPRPTVKLQSIDAVRFDEQSPGHYGPAFRLQLLQEDSEALPAWTLPFGGSAGEQERRGVTFSVRPGRGVKATAKVRF